MSRSEVTFLNKILPRAQAIGKAVANHQFVTMLNPKYRGEGFKWEGFVQFAVRWAEVTCWQSFTDAEWKRWKKEIVDAAGKSAKYDAERILDESGLLEWWPDPRRAPRQQLSEQAASRQEEVERLKSENEVLRGERAAVVKWLQAEVKRMYEAGQDRPAWFVLENRAERIERGEHRREEEP